MLHAEGGKGPGHLLAFSPMSMLEVQLFQFGASPASSSSKYYFYGTGSRYHQAAVVGAVHAQNARLAFFFFFMSILAHKSIAGRSISYSTCWWADEVEWHSSHLQWAMKERTLPAVSWSPDLQDQSRRFVSVDLRSLQA